MSNVLPVYASALDFGFCSKIVFEPTLKKSCLHCYVNKTILTNHYGKNRQNSSICLQFLNKIQNLVLMRTQAAHSTWICFPAFSICFKKCLVLLLRLLSWSARFFSWIDIDDFGFLIIYLFKQLFSIFLFYLTAPKKLGIIFEQKWNFISQFEVASNAFGNMRFVLLHEHWRKSKSWSSSTSHLFFFDKELL